MERKESQNKSILAWMKQGNAITPLIALNRFGCFRLSARIKDLRDIGYNISREIICENEKHYASYSLIF